MESAACWSVGEAWRGSSSPKRSRRSRSRRQVADLRVVGVRHDVGRRVEVARPPGASARRRAPARRSGRAGRGRGCRGRPHAGCTRRATSGSAASSTSNSPSSASRAESRVEATPESRFAPARLWARRSRGERIAAAIAAVVVLPFVAETSTEPSGSRAASRSTASGSSFESSFPGKVVPPPVPVSRERVPAALAAAIPATSGTRGRIGGA